MKLKKEFITQAMDGEQIMISLDTTIFSGIARSNSTAAFIIDCLKTETDSDAIVSAMAQKYDASKEVIARDLNNIIAQLREIGALEE